MEQIKYSSELFTENGEIRKEHLSKFKSYIEAAEEYARRVLNPQYYVARVWRNDEEFIQSRASELFGCVKDLEKLFLENAIDKEYEKITKLLKDHPNQVKYWKEYDWHESQDLRLHKLELLNQYKKDLLDAGSLFRRAKRNLGNDNVENAKKYYFDARVAYTRHIAA